MVYLRVFAIIILLSLFAGCNDMGEKESVAIQNEIIQSVDGNIFLSLKDAYLFADKKNPKRNTAEWSFKVLNKGRYEVWLTSHTKDTMHLTYDKPVVVHFQNYRLAAQPVGNEIVLDDVNVCKPYYRADSRIGSILIRDTGHYNLQVISEKVLPLEENINNAANTVFDQIILKPQIR